MRIHRIEGAEQTLAAFLVEALDRLAEAGIASIRSSRSLVRLAAGFRPRSVPPRRAIDVAEPFALGLQVLELPSTAATSGKSSLRSTLRARQGWKVRIAIPSRCDVRLAAKPSRAASSRASLRAFSSRAVLIASSALRAPRSASADVLWPPPVHRPPARGIFRRLDLIHQIAAQAQIFVRRLDELFLLRAGLLEA